MSDKRKSNLKSLRSENQHLRDLVISLSATLLRYIALDLPENGSTGAEQLLHEAELCFRCAKVPGLNGEVAAGLEAAGHGLMARAVKIEAALQREKWKK